MVGSSAKSADRTDALAGLSLVENLARMSTSESLDSTDELTPNCAYLLTTVFQLQL